MVMPDQRPSPPPPTGLDRQRALQVVRDIRTVSRRLGIAVLATLNQPATDVFYLFSHAVVLGSGGWAGPVWGEADMAGSGS